MSIVFGKFPIPFHQVFWKGQYCYAMVNLRPIRPNHILVCTLRPVSRFSDLNANELKEMMKASAIISKQLTRGVSSIAIQDGPEAGQSVDHVHVHIIPREAGSVLKVDSDRGDRTDVEMASEAAYLRQYLNLDAYM
ncbi:unnamed protein product [Blepharisma stoltei]|uniref:HIT domain-containing protein n=1 Tax=Blepharisma stoltei TaxID=1481888 RepID=A0AAU9IU49_9CILI|nr:unnamed protein product [Blepharisma stoltei]